MPVNLQNDPIWNQLDDLSRRLKNISLGTYFCRQGSASSAANPFEVKQPIR